jgi:predicted amidophosphoribosyltransferase
VLSAGPGGVEIAVAAASYEGAARALAHALKYGRRLGLAALGAELMAAACPAADLRGVIVPVPAAPLRGRWRGFDPAAELALALARLTGLPASDCLRRRSGPRQVGRVRAERLADPPSVALRRQAPRSVLLVDDVHTTGATLGACAAALRAGGSRRVIALCLARAR